MLKLRSPRGLGGIYKHEAISTELVQSGPTPIRFVLAPLQTSLLRIQHWPSDSGRNWHTSSSRGTIRCLASQSSAEKHSIGRRCHGRLLFSPPHNNTWDAPHATAQRCGNMSWTPPNPRCGISLLRAESEASIEGRQFCPYN